MPIWNGSSSITVAEVEAASEVGAAAAIASAGLATAADITTALDAKFPTLSRVAVTISGLGGGVIINGTIGKITRVFGLVIVRVSVAGTSQPVSVLAGDPTVLSVDVGWAPYSASAPSLDEPLYSVNADVFFLATDLATDDMQVVAFYDKIDA